MALATYADLIASLPVWLKRTDLTSIIPDFVALTEARINRELRVETMLTRGTLTVTSEFTSLPADFAGVRSARLTTDPYTVLSFLTPEQMGDYSNTQPTGNPKAIGIVGTQAWVLPVQTASVAVELTYYAKVAALSDTNTTNWLLTKHPDVYLWGGCLEGAIYTEDDNQVQKYSGLFDDAILAVKAADLRDTMGATLSASPSISPA
jgi:hypothetical protein